MYKQDSLAGTQHVMRDMAHAQEGSCKHLSTCRHRPRSKRHAHRRNIRQYPNTSSFIHGAWLKPSACTIDTKEDTMASRECASSGSFSSRYAISASCGGSVRALCIVAIDPEMA